MVQMVLPVLVRRALALASSSVLPPRRLLDFLVQSAHANQFYLLNHVPDLFDGDMVIFSAARSEDDYESSHKQNWRPYVAGNITVHSVDCSHNEMIVSLSKYSEQLKLSLEGALTSRLHVDKF